MPLFNSITIRAVSWAGLAFAAGSTAFLPTATCDGRDPPTATGVIVPGKRANPFEETEPAQLPEKGAAAGTTSFRAIPKGTSTPTVITHLSALEQPSTKELPSTVLPSSSDIAELMIARQLLEVRYNQITDQISMQAKSVQGLEKFNGEPEQLRSDIDELKGIVKDMGTTLQKRKIELDAAPRVSILQQASTPEPAGTARPYVAAGIGALLGLALVVIVVVVVRLLFGRKAPRGLSPEASSEPAPIRSTRWGKWRIAICSALVVAAALGTLGWFHFPAQYESAALVKVSTLDPAVWEQHTGIDFGAYKQNIIEMIRSAPIVGRAIEDKTIQDFPIYRKNIADPVTWLSEALQITGGNSELIRVSLKSEDPQGLKEIVDAVLGAFNTEVIEVARTDKLRETSGLESKLNAYKAQVIDKERQLYNLSQQIGTSDAQTATVQHRMQADALDTLLRLRTDLQWKISDLDFRLALAKALQELHKKTSAPAANEGKAARIEKPKE